MLQPEDPSVLWLLICGFIMAFVLAFGIGANDVANSFGTSVGAKVLTLFQACIIASIFELGGAILIGSKVSDTVRKGIIDITAFNGSEELAMAGAFSALTATSIWLLVATFLNLPVSGTHSIVGATIGYALVAFDGNGVTWGTFGKIAASWVISPLLSGFVSSVIFMLIDRFILRSSSPLTMGLRALPFLFGATMLINLFSIFYSSGEVFGMGAFHWYQILGICIGISVVLGLLVLFVVNPFLKKRILHGDDGDNVSSATYQKSYESTNSQVVVITTTTSNEPKDAAENKAFEVGQEEIEISDKNHLAIDNEVTTTNDNADLILDEKKIRSMSKRSRADTIRSRAESIRSRSRSMLGDVMKPVSEKTRSAIQDDPYSAQLFKYLQIVTASFGAFAHGGNDVSNAIGPVISLWLIYKNGEVASKAATPIWILIYGGAGIIVGLCVWGRRVIKTIGENLSPITPTSGFSIEIGSALTVILASNLGIPVSTTHCKVGSVVVVGRVRSKEVVDWSLFRNIVISWIVTMPITGAISAATYAILREVLY